MCVKPGDVGGLSDGHWGFSLGSVSLASPASRSRLRCDEAASVVCQRGGDQRKVGRARRNAFGDVDEHARRRAACAGDLEQLATLRAEPKAMHRPTGDVYERAASAMGGLPATV